MSTSKLPERLLTTSLAALISAVPAFFFGLAAGKQQIPPAKPDKTVVEHKFQPVPDHIDVKRLRLVDEEGAIRAELSVSPGNQPRFVMFHETGEPMVRITKDGYVALVEVLDRSGKHTVAMGVEKEPIKQAGAKQSVFFMDFHRKTATFTQAGFDPIWRQKQDP